MSAASLLAPPYLANFNSWPGNDICVSCRFGIGLLVAATEGVFVIVLSLALRTLLAPSLRNPTKYNKLSSSNSGGFSTIFSFIGYTAAAAGFVYWSTIFSTFWNFISWIMLAGPMVVLPSILLDRKRKSLLPRRLKLACWLCGILSFAAFPNVAILPEQIDRRMNNSVSLLTPQEPLVEMFRDKFMMEITEAEWEKLGFTERMLRVDEYVNRQVKWVEDYAQYRVVGLLLTPKEVLTTMRADCQGQAVATASLLMALGYHSALVETPFHWWTHAWDHNSNLEANLNVHGGAGGNGTVTPQPIDLVITNFPPACSYCPQVLARNFDTTLYAAPPWQAFAIAFTGMHEFQRDFAPNFDNGKSWKLAAAGLVLALVAALYGSYFQADFSLESIFGRFVAALPSGVISLLGLYGWAKVYYPVCLIHTVAMISISFTLACGPFRPARKVSRRNQPPVYLGYAV